ncbi:MAG: glycosyl hydrolase-related protein [Acidobacteriota bacterium]
MSCWQASRLNQPLLPFHTTPHEGRLGRDLSFLDCSQDNVAVRALKRAEDGDAIIVRLQELDGQPCPGTRIRAARPFVGVTEVDGQERPIGEVEPSDGALSVDLQSHAVRAFALELEEVDTVPVARSNRFLSLEFDCLATTEHGESSRTGFDGRGHSYPAELFPSTIEVAGAELRLAGAARGTPNAMTCHGQTVSVPEHSQASLHLLVASIDGYRRARIVTPEGAEHLDVPPFSGHLGRWPLRAALEDADSISNAVTKTRVAWIGTHRHGPKGEDEPYVFCYLFHSSIRLDPACREITLPNDPSIRIFALSLSSSPASLTRAANSLYD